MSQLLGLLGAAVLLLSVAATRPITVLAGFGLGIACIGLSYWLEARTVSPRRRRVRTIIRLTPN